MSEAKGAAAAGGGVVPTDVLEERLIDEEYKIWKKNTPFLYDYVMTHSLEWPSLTCQWLPKNNNNNTNNAAANATTEEHNLLIGTHTTGEQNYLMVASCVLPKPEHLSKENDNTTNNNTKVPRRSKSPNTTTTTTNATVTTAPEYDEEKNEFGGFGLAPNSGVVGKIQIHHKIKHEGEVNRARCMPQNHFIVASRGPNPQVYIFDRTKHASLPTGKAEDNVFSPQGVCVGHEREGYGMVWSTLQEGYLATASEDQTVRLWDVSQISAKPTAGSGNKKTDNGHQVKPLQTFRHHTDTVEDVDWHRRDASLLVSVGGDCRICLWDKRQTGGNGTNNNNNKPHFVVNEAHQADINSVAFNPHNEFCFATGSSDRTIGIWDVRRLKTKVHSLQDVHVDDVFTVQWAPHDEGILASCAADRRVAIWDLTRVGLEQSPEDAQDGPPELLFLHGGHTAKVSDLSWNPHAPWTMASTSEDNIFQIWTMAEEIYATDNRGRRDNNGEGLGPNELE